MLGPILFLLYIDDIADCVLDYTEIAIFADDVKIYKDVDSLNNLNSLNDVLLQNDLHGLDNWSNIWKPRFNYNKFIVLQTQYRVQAKKYQFPRAIQCFQWAWHNNIPRTSMAIS